MFDVLGVNADRPVGKLFEVIVMPPQPGAYEFTGQMRTYCGTLVVR